MKIDLENFRRREGRNPDPDELKGMLWPKGTPAKAIRTRSASWPTTSRPCGVLTPPAIDYWETAWDGKRRLAACLYVCERRLQQRRKERRRRVRVWQTGAHATNDQIDAIVTSLNFGTHLRSRGPRRACTGRLRRVHRRAGHRGEPAHAHRQGRNEIRRRVAQRYGIKTQEVTRYCKMVTWALEFEDFHREQGRDENEINSRTAELFQYFFELDAGVGDEKLPTASPATMPSGRSSTCCSTARSRISCRFVNCVGSTTQRRHSNSSRKPSAAPSKAVGQAGLADAIFTARKRSEEVRQVGRGNDLAGVAKWLREDVTFSVLSKLDVNVLA